MKGDEIALGPGKIELLSVLAETGSLNETAQRLDMSYMRAWTLVRTMNECFQEPLVKAERGGKTGGGMVLTDTGKEVLALYQEMNAASLAATKKQWASIQRLLKK